MPYPNIVAFVEGEMEQIFLNGNFHYVKVVSVSNGIGWSTSALGDQIATFYKARNYHGWWVMVWVDREKRAETAEEIEDSIRGKLLQAGVVSSNLKILIADRMSENIILADTKFMSHFFDEHDYEYTHSGRGGKHILAEKFKTKGINYKETKHGVAALKKIRIFRSAENCNAVKRFITLNPLACWWLDEDNEIPAG